MAIGKNRRIAAPPETPAGRTARRPSSPEAKAAANGAQHTVVCVQQGDGRYTAWIAEDPDIRFVGKTRAQAERVVSKVYTDTHGRQEPRSEEEDRLWIELARANRETRGITPSEYRRQRGPS
jgi:hypothetical protein